MAEKEKKNPFEKNISKVNPLLDNDKTFETLSSAVEAESKRELGKTTTTPQATDANDVTTKENSDNTKSSKTIAMVGSQDIGTAKMEKTVKRTIVIDKQSEPEHPILNGEKDKTI